MFFTNDDGETFVLQAGREFKLLHVNQLGEQTLASPALVDGRWYFRTASSLLAIESGSDLLPIVSLADGMKSPGSIVQRPPGRDTQAASATAPRRTRRRGDRQRIPRAHTEQQSREPLRRCQRAEHAQGGSGARCRQRPTHDEAGRYLRGCAPSATRTPISRVRSATLCASTP